MVFCSRSHLHRDAAGARACEVAWRVANRRRLGVDELVKELREVLARNEERRKAREKLL